MPGQKEVLWNSSENVGNLDLNNMQRFLRAFLVDWVVGQGGTFSGSKDFATGPFDRTKALFSLGDSCAPIPTLTNLQVTNIGGLIGQWKAGAPLPLTSGTPPANWGLDPYMMFYWVSPAELLTTHSAADPTNDRWDLVCVKLDDISNDSADSETRLQKQLVSSTFVISSAGFIKRRKVTLTKQVVVGTPAGSPTMPAVPAGFQPLYAVRIPATFASTFTGASNDFHDYRMPLGSFVVDVPAWQAIENGSGLAATGNAGAYRPMTLGASSTFDFIPHHIISPMSCRLIGVSILVGAQTGGAITATLGKYSVLSGGTYAIMGGNASWTLTNLLGLLPSGTDLAWADDRLGDDFGGGGNEAGNDPPTVDVKPPWGTGWPNGYAGGRVTAGGGFRQTPTIGLRVATAAATTLKIAMARFHFAGMSL